MSKEIKKCVYAGSFDPLTEGHMFMIRQGAKLFDVLVVALGINPDKHYSFSRDERLAAIRECTRDIPNVQVETFEGLYLVHYAASIGAGYILRGLRSSDDYEFERSMRNINADMNPDITSVFLMPPRHLCDISSSFVKGLVGPKGWQQVVKPYVPPPVYKMLLASKISWPAQSGGCDAKHD